MSNLEIDRRGKSRVCASFPVTVRGVDTNGERFKFDTVLDNVSSSGLYLHLPYPVVAGTRLFFVVQFSPASTSEVLAPRFAMLGVVRRAELKPDGVYGAAVAFTSRRQL